AGLDQFSPDLLGDDRIPRGLCEDTAESRSFATGAVDQRIERIQHAVDLSRGCLARNKKKITCRDTGQRRLRAESRGVDDDRTARGRKVLRGLPRLRGCVFYHRDTAKRPLPKGEPRYGPLGIGVDDCRSTACQMPMHRKATCQRTLAASAFHCCYSDYLSHGRTCLFRSRVMGESLAANATGFSAVILQMTPIGPGIYAVFRPTQQGRTVRSHQWSFSPVLSHRRII